MSGTSSECLGCGAFVTDRFARVFGDNDNRVYGCPECSTERELYGGATGGANLGP